MAVELYRRMGTDLPTFVLLLLLATLLSGLVLGVLVGSVARCAIGRYRAPSAFAPGAQRVAAYRSSG